MNGPEEIVLDPMDAAKSVLGDKLVQLEPFTMRVGGNSNVHAVATALYFNVRDHGKVILRTLGAGATQQASKAIAIASGRARTEGYELFAQMALHNEKQADEKLLTILSITVSRKAL